MAVATLEPRSLPPDGGSDDVAHFGKHLVELVIGQEDAQARDHRALLGEVRRVEILDQQRYREARMANDVLQVLPAPINVSA